MGFFKDKFFPDTSKPPIAGDGSSYFYAQNNTKGRETAFNVSIKNQLSANYELSNDYFSLLAESHYWCGLWISQTNNESIKKGLQIFLNQLFLAGTAGWYYDKIQECFIPIAISNYKLNKVGEFENGIGYNLYHNLGLRYTGESTKYSGEKLELNKENCGFFFYNVYLYGAWVLWYPFVKNRTKLINQIINASPILTKKLAYIVANSKTSDAELANFNDPYTPYLKIIKNTNDKQYQGTNKFEVISPTGDLSLEEARRHLDYYIEYNYRYLGRRINLNEKAERNINSEVQYTQSNYDNLEAVWLANLTNNCEAFKKYCSNFDLTFNVIDITDDTNKDITKDGDENDDTTRVSSTT